MFQFTSSQERTIQRAVDWYYNSSEQVFEFEGQAGTGKSVVLWEVVRRLGLKLREYMPMAFTGQASIVMRTKGFKNAKSIHSSLFEIVKTEKEIDGYDPFKSINTKLDTPVYTYEFREIPVGGIPDEVELFIIDEGYMVPKYMRNAILKHGKKVLVCGDCGQLPPIGDQPAFLVNHNIDHLTELTRQSLDNPIVYLADRARKGLPIHCGVYGNRVLVINDTEMTDNMISNVGNIICGTNRTRDHFNQYTRNLLNHHNPFPEYGERIICRENNWFIEQDSIALANGLSGFVVNIPDSSTYNGKTFQMDFLPDLCQLPFRNLKVDYEYLQSPYDIRNQMKNDRFHHNGEKFEYSYAITTHLSQGSEYPCGIYYEEFLRSNIQNQLNYTGITRFKEYMIYVKRTKRYH